MNSLPTSTAQLAPEDLAKWQTTTRLLSSLLNDGLISSSPAHNPYDNEQLGLLLHAHGRPASSPAVWINLSASGHRLTGHSETTVAAFPGDLSPPALITDTNASSGTLELAPAALMTHLRSTLDVDPVKDELWDAVCAELTNCTSNGRYWIEWYAKQEPLSIRSSMIRWEQALYTGHPLHPMHRTLSTQAPMPHISPENIASLMTHSISFISIPGSQVRISGRYRQALKELFTRYEIDGDVPGKVVIPCITMQIPVIKELHPDVEVLVEDAFQVQTQSSLRTVTIPFYDYDLKFALDVKIGSALRTISPWTVCILSELSTVLNEILPEDLWLMSDAGGVVGSSNDFNHAKHISCVFRENLNRKAIENNETLVVTGALQEIPPWSNECNAAIVFDLKTETQKMDWFEKYTEGIISAFVGPVVTHGVAFEAHAQNVLCRINRSSGQITGWATRDLGSIKIHMPTLAKSGYELFSAIEGSFVPSYDEEETWRIIQFCLFHNHLNVFIYRLGVDRLAAWAMIRDKLDAFFKKMSHHENAERLRSFLFAPVVPMKAFMVMKFSQMARIYDYRHVANVLLEGVDVSASTSGNQTPERIDDSRQQPIQTYRLPDGLEEKFGNTRAEIIPCSDGE